MLKPPQLKMNLILVERGELNDAKKMRKILPSFEVYFYCASWIFGILYSTYKVYSIGNQFSDSFAQSHLVKGWSILDRNKDDSDEDWSAWRPFILYTLSGWIVVHYVGARVTAFVNTKALPLWYFTLTSAFLVYHYGYTVLIIFSLQPILFTVLASFKNTRFTSWLMITLIVFLINFHYSLDFPLPVFVILLLYFGKFRVWLFCFILYSVFTQEKILTLYATNKEEEKILLPCLMWIYLRCISFYIEEEQKELKWFSVFSFFGYVFYLPSFFFGPIILYYNFSEKLCDGRRNKLVPQSVGLLIVNNIRYIFWIFLTELLLHYVYINTLLQYIEFLTKVNSNVWLMYGIGFGMGQFFFLKYTIVYGLALTWTKAEGYNVPEPPKCVACICLYSDMWRHFDEGLYLFIHRYIYQPCSKKLSSRLLGKLGCSCLCFLFVYIWHGLHNSIFIWSFLNFCGIVVERVAGEVSKTGPYLKLKKFLGPRNESRLIGVICAPLTTVSAISNFCFIGGAVVAKTYFNYIFRNDKLSNTFCLWFFVYCLCQVSLHLVSRKRYRKW